MAQKREIDWKDAFDEVTDFSHIIVDNGTAKGKKIDKDLAKAIFASEGAELTALQGGTTANPTILTAPGTTEFRFAQASPGEYKFGSGANMVATPGKMWRIEWVGGVPALKEMGTLPTVDTQDGNYDGFPNLIDGVVIVDGNVGATGIENNSLTTWKKIRYNVTENTTYEFNAINFVLSGSKHLCFYNNAGTFISKHTLNSNYSLPYKFTTPVGAVKVVQNIKEPADPATPSGLTLTSSLPVPENYVNGIKGKKIAASVLADTPATRNSIASVLNSDPNLSIARKMTYEQLKLAMTAGALKSGESIVVTNAPGALTITARASSANSIDSNILVPSLNHDYYKIDVSINKIFAYDDIACIPRNTAGTWSFVNDGGHVPKGVVSIEAPTAQSMKINYGKTYTKIHSLTYAPDETYTINGVMVGASVGLDNAIFQYSTIGLFGQIEEVSGNLAISAGIGFKDPLKSVTFNATTGVITVTHSALSYSGAFIQSMKEGMQAVLLSFGSSSCTFKMFDNSGNVILSPLGMKFLVQRTGVRTLTNSEMGIAGSNIWVQGLMMTEIS